MFRTRWNHYLLASDLDDFMVTATADSVTCDVEIIARSIDTMLKTLAQSENQIAGKSAQECNMAVHYIKRTLRALCDLMPFEPTFRTLHGKVAHRFDPPTAGQAYEAAGAAEMSIFAPFPVLYTDVNQAGRNAASLLTTAHDGPGIGDRSFGRSDIAALSQTAVRYSLEHASSQSEAARLKCSGSFCTKLHRAHHCRCFSLP